MRFINIFTTLFAATAISAAPLSPNELGDVIEKRQSNDIVDVAKGAGLTSLLDAVTAAGLVDTVEGLKDATVFAPTNDAFKAVGDVKTIPKDQLVNILKYHIVQGVVMSGSLQDGQTAKTIQGADVKISIKGSSILVNDAKVVQPDVGVKQGVVHVIDKVLMPPKKKCANGGGSEKEELRRGG